MSRPALPPYLDGLIAAWKSGQTGRDLHLGYWERPPGLAAPVQPGEFIAAQARLTRRVLALAPPPQEAGRRVLDIACGLGGTLAAVASSGPALDLVGVNIDRRQLEICRGLARPAETRLSLVEADACALPFAAASFEHVLCVEAMFHFRSRRVFLAEAARLLSAGGVLVATDILLRQPVSDAPWSEDAMTAALRRDYGPWPEPWVEAASIRHDAAAAGLDPIRAEDWRAQTLPSYRVVAPDAAPERHSRPDAGHVLRWLHAAGLLTYLAAAFRKSGG